jgi:hypothetical protein
MLISECGVSLMKFVVRLRKEQRERESESEKEGGGGGKEYRELCD